MYVFLMKVKEVLLGMNQYSKLFFQQNLISDVSYHSLKYITISFIWKYQHFSRHSCILTYFFACGKRKLDFQRIWVKDKDKTHRLLIFIFTPSSAKIENEMINYRKELKENWLLLYRNKYFVLSE